MQVPLVEGSREFRALLLSSGCATASTSPSYVRQLFKHLAASTPLTTSTGASNPAMATPGVNRTVSLHANNPEARNNCLLLLRYCLADLGSTTGSRGSGLLRRSMGGAVSDSSFKELAGLPLVPLADGSHGVFKTCAAVDATKLAELRAMGFSEGRSRQALVKHKEVQPAVEWLFAGGGEDEGVHDQPFVLCVQEEAHLLAGAGGRLISEAALLKGSSAGGDGGSGGVVAGAGTMTVEDDGADASVDDDGRVLRALRSSSLQASLNITSMRDELLPDLIGQTLPAEWRGGSGGGNSSTAFPWTPQRADHPNVDWFRRLWGYLASTRPSAVRLLAESYPVVPTGESVVCPLSLRSAVIDGSRLGPEVRAMLVKAGCRTLLPGVFSGGVNDSPDITSGVGGEEKVVEVPPKKDGAKAISRRQLPPPPPELFEYVRPGSRTGVLAALGTAKRSAGKSFLELMRSASADERNALREFLAREPAGELSDVDVAVCRALPILPLHSDGLAAARVLLSAAEEVTAGKFEANGSNVPQRTKPTLPTSLGDSGFAAADNGPLYLLLEAGNGLVGVESDDTKEDPSATAGMRQQPTWVEAHLFTPHFIKIGGAAAGRGGAAEAALAERLGVKLIGRAAFFVDHIFPRIVKLPAGLRDAAMVEALLEAPRLSQQHQGFRSALGNLAFVPAGGRVSTIRSRISIVPCCGCVFHRPRKYSRVRARACVCMPGLKLTCQHLLRLGANYCSYKANRSCRPGYRSPASRVTKSSFVQTID